LTITLDGPGADQFKHEAGGHRIQRVPRTERNGRVHSSTVTVAVLASGKAAGGVYDQRDPADFAVEWFNGTIGAGGQNHQKTANCARVTHLPTGIVKTAQTRSRANSLKNAMSAMNETLDEQKTRIEGHAVNRIRQAHVGTGERSDKRRTYQFKNDVATDHVTGKKAPLRKVFGGQFDLLW
jgi:peptide chain release factor 1